ncbi:MAG TPA: hypothetical protein DCG33_02735 [Prevotellaceae bacterium]|nr:hypothetical protein [Prevotellaceae bacterium]
MDDLISRQAAIEAVRNILKRVPTNAIRCVNVIRDLPSAQPEQQWIPCSERLPEKNVWVLVTFMMANGEVDIDIMRINRWDSAWETRDFDMAYRETVVAWMPLPEPYGGGQDDRVVSEDMRGEQHDQRGSEDRTALR